MSMIYGGSNVTFPDGTTQNTAPSGMGFKNRIINGALGIWQRGTTFNSISNQTYFADRFVANLGGTAPNFTRSTDAPAGFQYSANMVGSSTGYMGLGQRIESANCADLASQTVTLSWYAKCSSSAYGLYVSLDYANSADNFSSMTNIVNQVAVASISTGWTRYTFTYTLPANAANGLSVLIFTNSASTTATLNITGVQLEKGSTATSFDYRPYGTELALCQRYYEVASVSYAQWQAIYYDGSTQANNQYMPFQVTKRAAPTATVTSQYKYFSNYGGGASTSAVSISVNTSTTMYQFQYYATAGLGNGPIMNMGATTVVASAEL